MGKVYIVGAGPGDKDLITVKGLKCIQQADVILYDRLINKELLNEAKADALLIYSGKLPKRHGFIQETIHHNLVKYALEGKVVTRLKGGDPFVFGRGAEEAEVLKNAKIPFEIVPGITAGIAAPAYAGIPVTHRDVSSSFAMVTGHMKEGSDDRIDWGSLANGIDTLAIYMGVSNLAYICDQLLLHGKAKDTPVALVHWGTTATQQTVTGTLSTIIGRVAALNITNPSMIIVGDVVRFHDKLNWLSKEEHHVLLQQAFV